MLKWRQTVVIALFACLLIGIGWLDRGSSQHPPQDHAVSATQHNAESSTNNKQPTKSLRQRLSVVWNRTWEDPVAFYTFVLSIFTGLLFIVSAVQIVYLIRADRTAGKSANAALMSAQAAIGIELPIIRSARFPGLIRLAGPLTESNLNQPGIFTRDPGPYNLVAGLTFQNFGRSIAFPFKFEYGWKIAAQLPPEPEYLGSSHLAPTAIIRADETIYDLPRPGKAVEFDEREQAALKQKTTPLWVYISLHYRDFLNTSHEARFCWRYHSGNGVLIRADSAPPAYTRHA